MFAAACFVRSMSFAGVVRFIEYYAIIAAFSVHVNACRVTQKTHRKSIFCSFLIAAALSHLSRDENIFPSSLFYFFLVFVCVL